MKVLVTEATRNASHAIIRALQRANYPVIGSDCRRLAFAAHSRYTPPYYHSAALTDADYAESMLALVETLRPDILLPGNQLEHFCREKLRFCASTRLLVPDYEAWQAAYYNDRTLASCEKLGIAAPRVFAAEDAQAYLQLSSDHKLMIKPRADLGGGQGLQLIDTAAQLRRALQTLDPQHYFIQEFIPGPVGNMRSVALLYDASSRLRAWFTSHKLRQWPQHGGICALGRSTHEPQLVEFIAPFFSHWRWQGVAEVEIKIDARDNRPRLIEINPRFWGNSNFAVQAGVNFPAYVCDLLLGKPVHQPHYQTGLHYVNWSSYLRCVGADLLRADAKPAVLQGLLEVLRSPRVRNTDWRDWRFNLAKMQRELRDAVRG